MSYIGKEPADSFISFAKQDFTTSATTSYTLDNAVANENELALFINFVRQEPTTAYTASGTTLTLTSATTSSDDMYCVYLGQAKQTVNPPDGSVIAAKLASDSVTAAKLNDDIISGQTALASEPADTDEFLVSDAGTLKRIDYSLIKGGGAYTKLLETTINNNTELVYNNTYFTSTYRDFMFAFSDFDVGTDSTRLEMRISTDNGSSYISASEYRFAARTYKSDATLNSRAEQSYGYFEIFPDTLEYLARENANFFVNIFNPLSSSTDFSWYANGHFVASNGLACPFFSGGYWTNSSSTAVNTVKFTMSSGDMDQGKVTMYGRIS